MQLLVTHCEMAKAPAEDEKFYAKAKDYWAGIPATVNGMLGGYGHISSIDINGSLAFVGQYLEVTSLCNSMLS